MFGEFFISVFLKSPSFWYTQVEFHVMKVEIIGEITFVETIAAGSSVRSIARLRKLYGEGRWRKCKGFVMVRLPDGIVCQAEVHWYEAHGIGRREIKVKRILL